jgi:vanillate O-demethylase monooxygenase subunit
MERAGIRRAACSHARDLRASCRKQTVTATDREVVSIWEIPNFVAPAGLARYINSGDKPVDQRLDMRWNPGSSLRLQICITLAGEPPENGAHTFATHVLTPETELSTHYFYAASRTYMLGDANETEANRERNRHAFEDEDKPMIEAVQERMRGSDLFELGATMLGTDAAAIRVRRLLADLIKEEEAGSIMQHAHE